MANRETLKTAFKTALKTNAPQKNAIQANGAKVAEEIGERLEHLRKLTRETAKLQQTFVKSYQKLWSSEAVRTDPLARSLLLRIAGAGDIEQLERQVGALARRVAELSLRRRPPGGAAAGVRAAARARNRALAHEEIYREDRDEEAVPRRTLIRL